MPAPRDPPHRTGLVPYFERPPTARLPQRQGRLSAHRARVTGSPKDAPIDRAERPHRRFGARDIADGEIVADRLISGGVMRGWCPIREPIRLGSSRILRSSSPLRQPADVTA